MNKTFAFLVFTLVFCSARPASAWNPLRRRNPDVEHGNAAIERKQFDKAIKDYAKAGKKHPNEPTLQLDRGIALLQQNKHEEAKEALTKAANSAKDKNIRAKSWYNLGTGLLQQAQQAQPAERKELLTQSIDALKKSLRASPSDKDAAWNLAYAKRALEVAKQEEQQEKNQEDQQDQDKDQDPSQQNQNDKDNKPSKLDDKQKQEAQEKSDTKKNQEPEPTQQPAQDAPPPRSAQEVQKLLDALERQEKNLPTQRMRRSPASRVKPEKDW